MGAFRRVFVAFLLAHFPRDFRKERGDELRRSYEEAFRDATPPFALATALRLWWDAGTTSVRLRRWERERRRRGTNTGRWEMGSGWMDLRIALRSLLRSPVFTATMVAVMGLGIGANTAIFTVAHGLLLAPLPYEDGARIVRLENRYLPSGRTGWVSAPELAEYGTATDALSSVVALSPESMNLTGIETPLALDGLRASPGLLSLLGAAPALGRGFEADEGRPGAPPTVILGQGLWQRAFGSDPGVLGRTVELDGVARIVVGVLPPTYRPISEYLFPGRDEDFVVPLVTDPATFDDRSVEHHNLLPLARLPGAVEPAEAEVRLRAAVERVEARYPGISSAGSRDVALTPLREAAVGAAGRTLDLLFVGVGLVLLVASINVALLLLARAEARQGEAAVRAALGAGRARLAWSSAAEALLIGLAGGAAGLAAAALGGGAIRRLLPSALTVPGGMELGAPALVFTLGVSVAAGLLAGAIPSLVTARSGLQGALRSGRRRGGPARSQVRSALVIGQIAGAVVLAAGATLLVRSLQGLRSVDPGFESQGRHLVEISAPRSGYGDADAVRRLYTAVVEGLQARAGIESAAASWQTPQQAQVSDWPVYPERAGESEWVAADPNLVSPGYFDTFGIRLVEGRGFDADDADRPVGPVILNETAAAALWPGESAVGRRVNLSFGEPVWREVVGVVADVRGRGLGEAPRVQTYMTFGEGPFGTVPALTITTRGRLEGAGLAQAVRETLAGIDPNLPVGDVRSLDAQVAASVERERLVTVLVSLFASVALLLGAVGVYGAVAFEVRRRTPEIGLRIAIGAPPRGVVGSVLGDGARLGAAGIALGLAGALASGRLLESFLFDVSRNDPLTLALVSAGVLLVVVAASFLPAHRASTLDPGVAFRE